MQKTRRGLIVLILLGIGAWFASPYWVLYQIHNAVEQRDYQKLLTYVDLKQAKINPLMFIGKHHDGKDQAHYTGLNTFMVTTHQLPVTFILTRDGWSWKITQIE